MKKRINSFLDKYFGMQIVNTKNNFYASKYRSLIKQTETYFKGTVLPGVGESDDKRLYLLSQLEGTSIPEGLHLLNYLRNAIDVDGDVCELGVAQGATSALIANEIMHTHKKLWLFDSFEGLSKPTEKDVLKDDIFSLASIDAYKGKMSYGADFVKKRLNYIKFPFARVKIVPGFIEDTIKFANLPNKVCFAYIDFDFYEPVLTALNYLDKVIGIGGCLMIDDYNFFSTGAKTAADEFFERNTDRYDFILPDQSLGYYCMLIRK